MFCDESNRPGGEVFTTRPPVGGPSVPGDPDSLVDLDSPDDFVIEEARPDQPGRGPGRRGRPNAAPPGPGGKEGSRPGDSPEEYWPEPLSGPPSSRRPSPRG